jgi:hypothetical protein
MKEGRLLFYLFAIIANAILDGLVIKVLELMMIYELMALIALANILGLYCFMFWLLVVSPMAANGTRLIQVYSHRMWALVHPQATVFQRYHLG